MAHERNPKTITGFVTGATTAAVASYSSVVSGVVKKLQGGSFVEGYCEVMDAADRHVQSAIDFGDKHNETVVKAMLTGAASAVGAKTIPK